MNTSILTINNSIISNNLNMMIFFEKILKNRDILQEGGDPISIKNILTDMLNNYFSDKTRKNFNNIIEDTFYKYRSFENDFINRIYSFSEESYNIAINLIKDIFNIDLITILGDIHIPSDIKITNYNVLQLTTNIKTSNSSYYTKLLSAAKMLFSDFIIYINSFYNYNTDNINNALVSLILILFIDNNNIIFDIINKIYTSNDLIILNKNTTHVSAFYIHKNIIEYYPDDIDINENNYEFYFINTNLKQTIYKSLFTNLKNIILSFLFGMIFNSNFVIPNIKNIYNFNPYTENNLSSITQQYGTCFLYSQLLSVSLFLYKNINTITYKLQDKENLKLEKQYFDTNENSFILYEKQVPQIFQLIFYYAYQMIIDTKLELLNIKTKELSYYNYIYATLNEIYYSYHNFYKRSKSFTIFSNNILEPKIYANNLNTLYKNIIQYNSISNVIKIDLNNIDIKTTELIINNIDEFKNLKLETMYWHYPQEYAFMHDNIYNLINDFDKIDINHLYLGNFNKLVKKSDKTEFNNVYYYKKRKEVEFTNYNIFIPFGYTYDQFIDIILMSKTKAYHIDKGLLEYEEIKNNIFSIFLLDNINYDKNYDIIIHLFKQIDLNKKYSLYNYIIPFIINNIYEFRKIFINRYLILFNFLNIKIDKKILNLIEEFLILNLLSVFYIYYIYDKVITFIGSDYKFDLTKELISNYSKKILKEYYTIIINEKIYELKEIPKRIKFLIDDYKESYPLFILLKLLNPISDILNYKELPNIEEINNNLFSKYYLITDDKSYYENCVQYDIQYAVNNYYNLICNKLHKKISFLPYNNKFELTNILLKINGIVPFKLLYDDLLKLYTNMYTTAKRKSFYSLNNIALSFREINHKFKSLNDYNNSIIDKINKLKDIILIDKINYIRTLAACNYIRGFDILDSITNKNFKEMYIKYFEDIIIELCDIKDSKKASKGYMSCNNYYFNNVPYYIFVDEYKDLLTNKKSSVSTTEYTKYRCIEYNDQCKPLIKNHFYKRYLKQNKLLLIHSRRMIDKKSPFTLKQELEEKRKKRTTPEKSDELLSDDDFSQSLSDTLILSDSSGSLYLSDSDQDCYISDEKLDDDDYEEDIKLYNITSTSDYTTSDSTGFSNPSESSSLKTADSSSYIFPGATPAIITKDEDESDEDKPDEDEPDEDEPDEPFEDYPILKSDSLKRDSSYSLYKSNEYFKIPLNPK